MKEVLADREYSFLAEYLSTIETPVILDVGAHIGTFAIWILDTNDHAKIHSVEANPNTYELLCKNSTQYSKRGARWTTVHRAACSVDDGVVMFSDEGLSMGHRIDPKGTVVVKGVTLTSLVDRLTKEKSQVDLIKIDIEGAEEEFICKASNSLDKVSALVVEMHPRHCNTAKIMNVLEEHYYDIQYIGGRLTNKPLVFCKSNKSTTVDNNMDRG